MATNTFNALMAEVNQKISETSTATSNANAAVSKADAAAKNAASAAQAASEAADAANKAAEAASTEAAAWENAIYETETVAAGSAAGVNVSEVDGKKKVVFKVPRGNTGKDGPKGEPGKSGVTFTLSGTKLYITTN